MDDNDLLRDYAHTGSQRAFATLVERHVDLVYSAALRRTRGDPHRAKEVTQMVFIDLAKKASSLTRHTLLVGWLYRSTSWAASNLFRTEARRSAHEQQAAKEICAEVENAATPDWHEIRPWLDEALDQLRESEREAVLLRFFKNQSFAVVALHLGVPENTARMRVTRALEKLEIILRKKGVATTSTAMTLILANNTVHAAPAGLASSVTTTTLATVSGLASGATASGLIMAKLNYVAATAVLVGLGWGLSHEVRALNRDIVGTEEFRKNIAVERAELGREQGTQAKLDVVAKRLAVSAVAEVVDPVKLERRRLDLIVRKGELDADYTTLFWKLKLDPARLDAFKEMVVNRKQAIYDAQQLAKEDNLVIASYAEQQEIAREAARKIDMEISALIGSANYREFLRYENNPYLKVPFDQLGQPEAMQRAEAMAALFDEYASEYNENKFSANTLWPLPDAFVERAKAIATPEEYKNMLAGQINTKAFLRMTDIAVQAAYAGKLKLTPGSAREYGVESSAPTEIRVP
ncbi:RNA polymerase sigma factor [Oleiharenicola lentus]|uniref:RNA polymerase sigma factor n=1 Tax=Oleiharenicola lentus TaxID=2508720 RepID=UPI003F675E29